MVNALTNVKVIRDDAQWEVEIKAEIPAEVLERYRTETLKEIQTTAKLDGFRPGKAPLERIAAIYGEGVILKQAAEHAIQHELPELLAKESLLIIESPRVSIEAPIRQPADGKALVFTARAALAPKVELADYKTIAVRHPPVGGQATEVSDEEHTQALTHLRRERARIDKVEGGLEPQKAHEEAHKMEEKDLPELDDAFVQSLGYEHVAVFSEKLRGSIKSEKERQAQEKRRAAILDDLAKESTILYPAVLREYELNDMEARMRDDLSRVGRTHEEYLSEVKKTREELRKEWSPAADKRTRIRLILAEIARKENIDADQAQLAHELEHAKKHYPQANPEILRTNIAHAMRNEAVLKWLESLA